MGRKKIDIDWNRVDKLLQKSLAEIQEIRGLRIKKRVA